MNEFMVMPADEVVSHGVDKYGLVDLYGDGERWGRYIGDEYVYAWHAQDSDKMTNGLLSSTDRISPYKTKIWKLDDYSSPAYIISRMALDYVEFPEDFFSLRGTLDECEDWVNDMGVDYYSDENGIAVLIRRDDVFYHARVGKGADGDMEIGFSVREANNE